MGAIQQSEDDREGSEQAVSQAHPGPDFGCEAGELASPSTGETGCNLQFQYPSIVPSSVAPK